MNNNPQSSTGLRGAGSRSAGFQPAERNLVLAALAYLLSGLYLVGPGEEALVRSFGAVVSERVRPGLHYRVPYPFTQVDKLRVAEVRRVIVGARPSDVVLSRGVRTDGELLSADQNIVHVQLTVQYNVTSLRNHLFRIADADLLIRNAAAATLSEVVNSRPIDAALTSGKTEIVSDMHSRLLEVLQRYRLGVTIRQISLERAQPPEEVAAAFRDVTNAREDRDRFVNEADGYRRSLEPQARGQAQQRLVQAQADRERKINEAIGEAARFRKLAVEYRKAPEVTARRLYLEAMEEIMPGIRKVILDSAGGQSPVDLGILRAP